MSYRPSSTKLTTLEQLAGARPQWRARSEVVVLANGVFDLLHVGHVRYLEAARALGDRLIVAVNTDRSTRAYKGPGRPVIPESERAEVLAALAAVDHVLLFDEDTVARVLEQLTPDIHAKGTDYTPETIPERGVVAAYGGRSVVCGDPKAHSSSALIQGLGPRDSGQT